MLRAIHALTSLERYNRAGLSCAGRLHAASVPLRNFLEVSKELRTWFGMQVTKGGVSTAEGVHLWTCLVLWKD